MLKARVAPEQPDSQIKSNHWSNTQKWISAKENIHQCFTSCASPLRQLKQFYFQLWFQPFLCFCVGFKYLISKRQRFTNYGRKSETILHVQQNPLTTKSNRDVLKKLHFYVSLILVRSLRAFGLRVSHLAWNQQQLNWPSYLVNSSNISGLREKVGSRCSNQFRFALACSDHSWNLQRCC